MKKTKTQIYIDDALAEAVKAGRGVNIENNNLEFTIDVGDAVSDLCKAVKANARAIEAAAAALKDHKSIGMNFEGIK